MLSTGNLGQVRAIIIDGLMARRGKAIEPALINELTTEIMEQINNLKEEAVETLIEELKGG